MEDHEIIALYWDRDENAIGETAAKYGGYLHNIAYNILAVRQDSEECVSDAYLRTWNAIPPKKPENLKLYLGRVTRNLALDRRKADTTEKRGGGQVVLALEELRDCVSDHSTPETALDEKYLAEKITEFLRNQPETARKCFVLRYWYLEPVSAIASRLGISPAKTKSLLHRTRNKLKEHLYKEGIWL